MLSAFPTKIIKGIRMRQMIAVTIPEDGLISAAMGSGIPLTTSKSGILRMAAAIAGGMSKDEARQYASTTRKDHSLETGPKQVIAEAPDELISLLDARYENRAFGIRVGIGMMAGLSRKQAESWARMHVGRCE
jgi:hypothetical protein